MAGRPVLLLLHDIKSENMAAILQVAFCILLSLASARAITLPDSYYAKGTIKLPYAGVVEPFETWIDGTNQVSRIDYYGGIGKIGAAVLCIV